MTFDYAVIGRGLWGSAAAFWLAQAGYRIALIGPGEPADYAQFDGPFSSHFDAARITRRIDTDPFWAEVSTASMARYGTLQSTSGIPFYAPSGGMMASDGPEFAARITKVAEATGARTERLSGTELAQRFPMFAFAEGTIGVLDPTGGTIDPRAMRHAHETLAIRHGATVLREIAVALDGGSIRLASGRSVSAGHVLVAQGSYARLTPLLAPRPDMTVAARTICLAEVSQSEAERLCNMPSLIWHGAKDESAHYLLPPVTYPDGRIRLKIGGELTDRLISTQAEARAWFHSGGDPDVGAYLENALRGLMPKLEIGSISTAPCILSHNASGYPEISRISDRLTIATACNGAGAKCADELGRRAASVAAGYDITLRLALANVET
ncbi:MAG: FAD-dependent oxidoreductase [Pseudomonadota bacterium]